MKSLATLFLRANKLSGAVPSVLAVLRRLQQLKISLQDKSGFRGLIPEAFFYLRALILIQATDNQLSGPIPDTLWSLSRMWWVELTSNKLTGTLPEALGAMARLGPFVVNRNKLRGCIPESAGLAKGLRWMLAFDNALTGAIPESFGSLLQLERLLLHVNKIAGVVPEKLWVSPRLTLFVLADNWIQGRIPDRVADESIDEWSVAGNLLGGSFPEFVGSYPKLKKLKVDRNQLHGSMPDALCRMQALTTLRVTENPMSGTSPDCIWMMQKMQDLWLGWDTLFGSLPPSLRSFTGLRSLRYRSHVVEGQLPASLGSLLKLSTLAVTHSSSMHTGLEGLIPPGLARAHSLRVVQLPRNSLQGGIPSFASTLLVLGLQENSLSAIPELRFKHQRAGILLHHNRLSCQLPRCEDQLVQLALVAVGNHLKYPYGDFPAWVQDFERPGLLWVQQASPLAAARVPLGFVLMAAVIQKNLGFREAARLLGSWQTAHGPVKPLKDFSRSFHIVFGRLLLGSSVLLTLVLDAEYYACPSLAAFATACLSERVLVHVLAAGLWSSLVFHARHPYWMYQAGSYWSVKLTLSWLAWILLVFALSVAVMLDVASRSVPDFLSGFGTWLAAIDAGIGVCQALVQSFLIPSLARRLRRIRKASLVSVAGLLTSSVLPALVVMHLDGACWDHWASWWGPCREKDCQVLEVSIASTIWGQDTQETEHYMEMHRDDICTGAKKPFDADACARGIILKLQGIVSAKLITMGLFIPTGRIIFYSLYRGTENVKVRYAWLLQVALSLGAPLPLLVSLLYINLLTDGFIVAASCARPSFQHTSIYISTRAGVLGAMLASLLLYLAFLHGDSPLSSMLLLCMAIFPSLQQSCNASHRS